MAEVVVLGAGLSGTLMAFEMKAKLRKEDRLLRHIFSKKKIDKLVNWTALAHPTSEHMREVISNVQK